MRLVVNDKGGKVEPAEADFEPKVGQALPLVLPPSTLAVASQADRGCLSAGVPAVLAKAAHLLCLRVVSPAGCNG